MNQVDRTPQHGAPRARYLCGSALFAVLLVHSAAHAQTSLKGSDDKQSFYLSQDFPADAIQSDWNRGMSITELSVTDGTWFLVMTADELLNAENIGQTWATASGWSEANDTIEEKRDEGYRVTSWTYHDGLYALVFSSNVNIDEQRTTYAGGLTDFMSQLIRLQDEGWGITDVFRDASDWVAILSKGSGALPLAHEISEVASCSDLHSNSGSSLLSVRAGDGQALALFGTGYDWRHDIGDQRLTAVSTLDELGAFASEAKRDARSITSVVNLGNTWCAAASRGALSNEGNLRTDDDDAGTVTLPTCNACDIFQQLAGKTCC